ncbi:MFS transporter [Nocardia gipuzkoensis]|uniref:MFS transporter n=1 Tax=Nocardia gipuzkoensis TaxID=2749991 RepID=UPI001C676AFE|nr:MFS transporter [Nocardia gipuzkoensis]
MTATVSEESTGRATPAPGGRQVYAIAGCHFVASFAALGLPPYLTEMLPELGDPSARLAGLLYVVPTVFGGLGAPLWGRLADRFGRKRLLLRAQLGLAVAFLLAGVADSLPVFTAALVLQGVLGGTFAASNGYLGAALRGPALARALTVLQGSARAALVFAPIVVGLLSHWLSPHRQYAVLAVLPLAAALMLAWLPEPAAPVTPPHSAAASQPRDAPKSTSLRSLFALEFTFVFTTVISFPYLIALTAERLPGTAPVVAGVLFALPHLVYLLTSLAVHRLVDNPTRPIVLGFAALAVGLAAHAVADSLGELVAARLVLGVGLTFGLVGRNILAARRAHGRAPGAMFGSLEFFAKAGAVTAGVAATAAALWFGPAAPAFVGGLAAVLALLVILAAGFVAPRVHRFPYPLGSRPMSVPTETLLPAAGPAPATALPSADDVVTYTLLNCLLREVSGPEQQISVVDGHLVLRLPRRDVVLRVRLRRSSLFGAHRFTGPVTEQRSGQWVPVSWDRLAQHAQTELSLHTGVNNDEFTDQIASSHQTIQATLDSRTAAGGGGTGKVARYLTSERSLLFGHRFHPTPKARSGAPEAWARYAPETGATFGLRLLAVRTQLLAQECVAPDAVAPLDRLHPDVPPGYRLLPAHPWQYEIFCDNPDLRHAMVRGDVLDLGTGDRPFAATASVRTVYDGETFLKFSLNVRITNCLRKNASYELSGAVALTRILEPVLDDLHTRFPGSAMLREPAYRSLALPGRDGVVDRTLLEGFGVIVREGLAARLSPGATPLLAAAVADEYPTGPAHISRLLPDTTPDTALRWWSTYLELLIPPVLAAYFDHGVVLEPHLQNVVVGVDDTGMPVQVLFRDLEGTKLLPELHADALGGLLPEVAARMTYDAQQGWDRVVYCLLVNHIAEMLAALADQHPDHEVTLWGRVHAVLADYAENHGCPPRLAALLAGVPLPAKTNLLTRWERKPDREAGYVRIPSPFSNGERITVGTEVNPAEGALR